MEPWDMDWGKEAEKVLGSPTPQETETTKEPWEVDWGKKAAEALKKPLSALGGIPTRYDTIVPKKSIVAPSKRPQVPSIDSVFTNLIQAESKGVHGAGDKLTTSPKGAEGITQLMPTTAANPGFGIKPVQDKSEKEYLRVGKEYLSALYGRYRDWEKALAAYNAGMGNVEKAIGKAERYGGDWKEFLPKKKETLPYIEKILRKTNA